MKKPLQLTLRNIASSEALETDIRERMEKLERFHPHIVGCHVTVEVPHRHKHQGRCFNVRIDLTIPGGEILVNRDLHADLYVALRDAFDAARRRLESHQERQRGDVKTHEPSWQGRIARVYPEEGFGFIETPDGRELYFSAENLVNETLDRLTAGAQVQFIEDLGDEGRQAKRVSVGHHAIA